MLKKGAKLSVKNDDGLTPLDMASKEFKAHFADARRQMRQMTQNETQNRRKSQGKRQRSKDVRRGKSKPSNVKRERSQDGKAKELLVDKKPKKMDYMSTKVDSLPVENDSKKSSENELVPSIGPKDFKVHAILGKGSFGEVYLVEKVDDKKIYAMKVLYKSNIISKSQSRPQISNFSS